VTTVIVPAAEPPPYVAVTVTVVGGDPAEVVTEKGASVAPARTVTLAGTEAVTGLELDNETRAPEGGASPESVTVPMAD
jgi:hypothetical protein